MNLILDLDNTLIDGWIENDPYENENGQCPVVTLVARPFLTDFLKFAFDTFERVSIWTNASRMWYELCHDRILCECIPEGKKFHFVKTIDDGLVIIPSSQPKLLKKIFNMYSEYNIMNTLILDDAPHTYRLNRSCAIPINPFVSHKNPFAEEKITGTITEELCNSDNELNRVMGVITKLLDMERDKSNHK
jgi:hypothetical protein